MKLTKYIKNQCISIIIYLLTTFLIILTMRAFKLSIDVCIFILIILIINGVLIIGINYVRKNKFYKMYLNNLNQLSDKYLILETIPEPNTYEEKIIVDSLYEINKSMIENISNYKNNIEEFKEFVELWIHDVKIPISSMVLKCHNNKDKYSKDLLSILRRLDNNIDEILYYVRSEDTEKDFSISEFGLKDIVKNVSIKNKDDLLENKIALEVNVDNVKINTDKKWLEFIINQIINNSIKYKKEKNASIIINSINNKDEVILEIIDNGIGIPSKDIKRVFEKSFTGTNGRNKVKSTGMGLYIVKNLCNKLGHQVNVESEEGKYTKVILKFGKNELYKI